MQQPVVVVGLCLSGCTSVVLSFNYKDWTVAVKCLFAGNDAQEEVAAIS